MTILANICATPGCNRASFNTYCWNCTDKSTLLEAPEETERMSKRELLEDIQRDLKELQSQIEGLRAGLEALVVLLPKKDPPPFVPPLEDIAKAPLDEGFEIKYQHPYSRPEKYYVQNDKWPPEWFGESLVGCGTQLREEDPITPQDPYRDLPRPVG